MTKKIIQLFFLPLSVFLRGVKITRGAKILDIGCGSGGFLFMLRRLGMDTYGIEPNKYGCYLAKSHGVNAFRGNLEQSTIKPGTFDVILLNHVLEHLPNPASHLDLIRKLLKPGGTAIITVPNTDSFTFKIFGENWAPLCTPQHLYAFSSSNMVQYAEQVGFRVSKIRQLASTFGILRSIEFVLRESGERRIKDVSKILKYLLYVVAIIIVYLSIILKQSDTVEFYLENPE